MVTLCDVRDVAPGTAVRAEAGGRTYAVFNVGGTLFVTQDECTHGPGLLSEGLVLEDEFEVECPFHQGRFHIPTGKPTFAPCTEALRIWTAVVVDGRVCIDPDQR